MGLDNSFRSFIQGHSKMVLPLTYLTNSHEKFTWTDECTKAFESVKHALTHAQVLALPDLAKPFEIIVDASGE